MTIVCRSVPFLCLLCFPFVDLQPIFAPVVLSNFSHNNDQFIYRLIVYSNSISNKSNFVL